MKYRIIFLICLCTGNSLAHEDSVWQQKPNIQLSGFVDIFYVYDFNQPKTNYRQGFLYNHNRHNEFNLNLGYIKLGVKHSKYRANIALQAGTYSNDNYSQEPGLLKNVFEANVGISLNKKNNLWLDAGIFSSHIGFESAISSDNLTMTRSLLAENSPYYFSGLKLNYKPSDNWEFNALLVNGWQRIRRLSGNSMLSTGSQITFTPSQKLKLNWSTFIGTDDPNAFRRMRYFNNFYGQFKFAKRFELIAGFDFGFQQESKKSDNYDLWYSPVLIAVYSLNSKWKIALRGEHYQDENGVIIPTSTLNGFQTSGLSVNLDYSPVSNVICRLEGRYLNSKDPVFKIKSGATSYSNFILGASMCVKIEN